MKVTPLICNDPGKRKTTVFAATTFYIGNCWILRGKYIASDTNSTLGATCKLSKYQIHFKVPSVVNKDVLGIFINVVNPRLCFQYEQFLDTSQK